MTEAPKTGFLATKLNYIALLHLILSGTECGTLIFATYTKTEKRLKLLLENKLCEVLKIKFLSVVLFYFEGL